MIVIHYQDATHFMVPRVNLIISKFNINIYIYIHILIYIYIYIYIYILIVCKTCFNEFVKCL